ncbi:hypothetical protein H8959_013022 [Pygathrix nigripes]
MTLGHQFHHSEEGTEAARTQSTELLTLLKMPSYPRCHREAGPAHGQLAGGEGRGPPAQVRAGGPFSGACAEQRDQKPSGLCARSGPCSSCEGLLELLPAVPCVWAGRGQGESVQMIP